MKPRLVKAADRRAPTHAERLAKAIRDSEHVKVQLGRMLQVLAEINSELRFLASVSPEKQGEQQQPEVSIG